MRPRFHQSIKVYRGGFGPDGRRVLGAAVATVSGATWKTPAKVVANAGEVATIDGQGFLEAGTDLRRGDVLEVIAPASGQRFEVMRVPPAHDHFGTESHVGADLREYEQTD